MLLLCRCPSERAHGRRIATPCLCRLNPHAGSLAVCGRQAPPLPAFQRWACPLLPERGLYVCAHTCVSVYAYANTMFTKGVCMYVYALRVLKPWRCKVCTNHQCTRSAKFHNGPKPPKIRKYATRAMQLRSPELVMQKVARMPSTSKNADFPNITWHVQRAESECKGPAASTCGTQCLQTTDCWDPCARVNAVAVLCFGKGAFGPLPKHCPFTSTVQCQISRLCLFVAHSVCRL